jgi:hypothetical protein
MKGSTIFFIPTERISENCAELRFYWEIWHPTHSHWHFEVES